MDGKPPNPYAPGAAATANPYAPGAAATADPYAPGASVLEANRAARPLSRLLAVLASLLGCFPIPGIGLYLLGRRRRFLCWAIPGIAVFWLGSLGGLSGQPIVWLLTIGAVMIAGLTAVVDTALARRGAEAPAGLAALPVAALLVAGSFATSAGVRIWLLEAFEVPAGSMLPTLLEGDHIMVRKLSPRVERGDVVVFRYPIDPKIDYVKRVVALGGDRIEVRGQEVIVNGRELAHREAAAPFPEPPEHPMAGPTTLLEETNGRARYLVQYERAGSPAFAVTVPPGHLFVMGDNRDNSNDSRVWGTVPAENVKGKVLFVFWSRRPDGTARWARVGWRVE
jgi:signal peptidase I